MKGEINVNNCCTVNNNDEIAVILEKIARLQREVVHEELEERFCDANCLGEDVVFNKLNTRPISVFTDDDEPWHCPTKRNEDGCNRNEHEETCVFRVEKVVNDSVVLRALKERRPSREMNERGRNRHERFESTDSFITIKLHRIAALRCFKDTFVDLCIR